MLLQPLALLIKCYLKEKHIFLRHNKYHSLPEISEKVHITAKFQRTKFDKNAKSGVNAFSITSIYLIQVIMEQNYHNNC